MSFRTAYSSFKSGRRPSKPQGPIRDLTPEQWQKQMDKYYVQEMRKKNGR
jgi:hypothetical protein